MKTIGLLGGMSWESTQSYYRLINEGVKNTLGGLHSAQIVLYSVDFAPIEQMQHQNDWDGTERVLREAAQNIERAGADFLLICTNTMHKVAPGIEAAISIPLLHIADATGEAIKAQGYSKIGLLGTAFTMEQDFYKGRLIEKYGLEVLTPDVSERKLIHDVIYQELCLGKIVPESRKRYQEIVQKLQARGAEAVILGCTEISLLLDQAGSPLPLFDTTAIHARKAVQMATASS